MSANKHYSSPVAKQVPFNNNGTDFSATNVQDAIEEIGVSASPGFTWGRAGNSNAGTWLDNDGVSSNRAGRYVSIATPSIVQIFTANENIATYTLSIYEHQGNSVGLTLLTTLAVTAARGAASAVSIPVTQGGQLAIQVSAGTGSNIVAGLILKGSSS